MDAQTIDNILSKAKVDKNGRIRNKGKLNDMILSEHLKSVKKMLLTPNDKAHFIDVLINQSR